MSQFLLIALHLVLMRSPPVSPDPRTLIISDADHARAERLVEQLGSVLYQTRNAATLELRAMGRLALPSLEAARHSDNPEVRLRVNLMLPKIRRADYEAKLRTFLADIQGKYDHQLPGWDKFQTIVGNNLAARRLFIELMKSPANRPLLEAVALSSKELVQRLVQRQTELFRLMHPHIFFGQPQPEQTNPTFIDVMTLVFAETIAEELPPANENSTSAATLLNSIIFKKEMTSEPSTGPAHKLLLAWCDAQPGNARIEPLMNLALQFDWPETHKYAIKMLETQGINKHEAGMAIMVLGRYGTHADAKRIQPYLTDRSIFNSKTKAYKESQFRDVALAVGVLVTQRKLDNFGIRVYSDIHLRAPFIVYFFDNDADREKAFAKWNRLEPDLAVKPLLTK